MAGSLEKLEEDTFYEDNYGEMPPTDIVAYNELRSCADLFRMQEQKILDISPEFQREVVWNPASQTRFIDSLIKKYPTIDAHYFTPSMKDIEENMHDAFYYADVPANASSLLSHYFLMRMIKQNNVTVVLDGQGSDEYLGGYNHTFYRSVADKLSAGHLINALSTTGEVNKNLKAGFGKTIKHFGKSILSLTNNEQSLYELEYKNYYPFMTTADKNKIPFNLEKKPGNKLTNFLYHLIFTTSLQSILHYEDRMAMAFSIESRVPFLDHRLVEFCFTLNNDDKVHGSVTKYMLRKSLEKVLPNDIAFRKDKQGFTTPGETKWLRGPLKHLLEVDYAMVLEFETEENLPQYIYYRTDPGLRRRRARTSG